MEDMKTQAKKEILSDLIQVMNQMMGEKVSPKDPHSAMELDIKAQAMPKDKGMQDMLGLKGDQQDDESMESPKEEASESPAEEKAEDSMEMDANPEDESKEDPKEESMESPSMEASEGDADDINPKFLASLKATKEMKKK
jgi:hypothetical protein